MNALTTLTPKQLRRAADLQERIQTLKAELEQILGAPIQTALPVAKEPKKKRKKFSAATRANMKKAQQARWAKIHADKQAQAKT
jgi:hypothetical protein